MQSRFSTYKYLTYYTNPTVKNSKNQKIYFILQRSIKDCYENCLKLDVFVDLGCAEFLESRSIGCLHFENVLFLSLFLCFSSLDFFS